MYKSSKTEQNIGIGTFYHILYFMFTNYLFNGHFSSEPLENVNYFFLNYNPSTFKLEPFKRIHKK